MSNLCYNCRKVEWSGVIIVYRQRFLDICHGRIPKDNMTLMKERSLMNTGATGEYLYYKLQDFVYEEVLSEYILHPKVSFILIIIIRIYTAKSHPSTPKPKDVYHLPYLFPCFCFSWSLSLGSSMIVAVFLFSSYHVVAKDYLPF